MTVLLDWLTPDEWQAVRLSLVVAGRSVLFGLPLAVAAAYAIARGRFPGRALLDALAHLPLVLPPVVVGWGLLLFGVQPWNFPYYQLARFAAPNLIDVPP